MYFSVILSIFWILNERIKLAFIFLKLGFEYMVRLLTAVSRQSSISLYYIVSRNSTYLYRYKDVTPSISISLVKKSIKIVTFVVEFGQTMNKWIFFGFLFFNFCESKVCEELDGLWHNFDATSQNWPFPKNQNYFLTNRPIFVYIEVFNPSVTIKPWI